MNDPEEPLACAVCKTVLDWKTNMATGETWPVHSARILLAGEDHQPVPLPMSQVPGAVGRCDFCSEPPAWVYRTEDQITNRPLSEKRWVSRGEARKRGPAARVLRRETTRSDVRAWDEMWSACQPCAELIEARNLPGLVSRGVDHLPRQATNSAKKYRERRGELYEFYERFFEGLRPGRGRITPDHPAGIWDTEEDAP